MTLKRLLVPLFVLLLLAACTSREETRESFAGAPVIIISVDTLRADHLPAYGYTGVSTPAIDALRRDSILYTSAWAHVPLTLPSHASILTGLLPAAHRVRNNIGYQLDPGVVTIPAMLKGAGYESGAAVSAYVLRSSTGIASSFDFYDDGIVSRTNVAIGGLQRSGADTSAVAQQWIAARKEKPFFFMLHLFEPHAPYDPPEPFRSRYQSRYDGEIAHSDQVVGEFLDALRSQGLYDRAMIIFLSDHGEGLGQHGEPEHGVFLYRESIRVPLMVKLPRQTRAGESVPHPVGLIDVLPTIAEVAGVEPPSGVQGVSLLRQDDAASARRIFSETLYPRIHLGWSELRSLAGEQHHFIQAPRPELYDMSSDPAETKNVLAEERRVYASMREELERYGSAVDLPSSIDPEEAKKLAALGYLGSSAAPAAGPLPDPKDGMPELAAMMQAMRFAHEGDHERAVTELRVIVSRNPLLMDAWNQLGMSLEALGRYEQSVAAYRKAIEAAPSMAGEFGLRLAGVFLRLGRLDDAAEHARLGEKVNPGGAHLLLARVELERKQFARAEQEARLAMADPHNDIHARVLLARVYGQQDRAKEALEIALQAAAEAEKRKAGPVESLYYAIGDALARMQEYVRAEQALQKEIALFPGNQQAYASLYLVRIVTNRIDEANAALEAMVSANRTRSAMLFAAETAEAVGDLRSAAAWRQRAARAK